MRPDGYSYEDLKKGKRRGSQQYQASRRLRGPGNVRHPAARTREREATSARALSVSNRYRLVPGGGPPLP